MSPLSDLSAAEQSALLNKIAGDSLAGTVLKEILYWFSPSKRDGKARVRIVKNGKYWWACPRSYWEDKGITRHQYQRIVDHLKATKLIETERTLFNGKVTPLLRLNVDRLEQLAIFWSTSGQSIDRKSANRMTEKRPIDWPKSGQSITTVFTTTTFDNHVVATVSQEPVQVKAKSKEPVKKQDQKQEQEATPEQEPKVSLALLHKHHPHLIESATMTKASDVLAKFPDRHKGVTRPTYDAKWKAEANGLTGEYVYHLTLKERKQLNDVAKALQGSPHDAMAVMVYAIRNWSAFATRAIQNAGQSIAPQKPVVGFYLKHYGTAILMMDADAEREKAQAAAAAKLKENPVPSPKKQPIAAKADLPSDDEVAQIIAEAKAAAEAKAKAKVATNKG